jgi:Secretion system C-terminal sorting domain
MKHFNRIQIFSILILCCFLSTSLNGASLRQQMQELNSYWNAFNPSLAELDQEIVFQNEEQKIRRHLILVEQTLRTNSGNLNKEQMNNRNLCLDILHQYALKGRFPKNTHHPGKRIPYFIDDENTPCAVGHLIIETGFKNIAEKIKTESNYSYLADLVNQYNELPIWAEKFGFSTTELAWIQPAYSFPNLYTLNFPLSDTSYIINPHCQGSLDGAFAIDSNLFASSPKPLTAKLELSTSIYNPIVWNQLPAETYLITITDGAMNTTVSSLTLIAQQNPMVTTHTITNSGCQQTGAIAVNTIGGTAPYSYLIANIGAINATLPMPLLNPSFYGSSNNFTGLNGSFYQIVVKDAQNCYRTFNATVEDSSAESYSFILVPNTCVNNTATVVVNTYATTLQIPLVLDTFLLAAGTNTITVTNSIGCSKIQTVVVPNSYWQAIATKSQNIICNGGTVSVNVQALSNSNLAFGPFIGAQNVTLGAGNHSYVLTDKYGCKDTAFITITQPQAISGIVASTSILCNGGLSTINASINNAQGNYIANYTNGQQLAAGNYSLSVVDNNNCSAVIPFVITQPAALVNTVTYNPILCFGDTTSFQYSTVGGTLPYQYNFAPNLPITSSSNTIIAVDANGCFTTQIIVVTEPALLQPIQASAVSTATGFEISGVAIGGTLPYTYTFIKKTSNGDSVIGNYSTLPILVSDTGSYSLVIIDKNNCSVSSSIFANYPTLIKELNTNQFEIYPNPGADFITLRNLNAAMIGEKIQVLNAQGAVVANQKITNSTLVFDMRNAPSGLYFIQSRNTKAKWIKVSN